MLRVGAVVDGLPRRGSEDPPAFPPQLTGLITFLMLLGAVLAEQLNQRSREADDASACPRLGLGGDTVHIAPLRTGARTPAT